MPLKFEQRSTLLPVVDVQGKLVGIVDRQSILKRIVT
jgi:predicted transcriptional regulator